MTLARLRAMSAAEFKRFEHDDPQLANVAGALTPSSPLKLFALKPQLSSIYETALSVNAQVDPGVQLSDLRYAVYAGVNQLPDARGGCS